MTALTARQLRASMPHLNITRTLFTAMCVGIIFWLIGNEAITWDGVPDRDPLGSEPYIAYGLSLLLVILPLTVWWAPRASFLTAVVAGWWMATHSSFVGLAGWAVIGTAVLALFLTLVADLCAVPTGPHRRLPEVTRFADTPAGERSLAWWAMAVPSIAAMVAIPALLVWHHLEMQGQAAFEARADVVMATVRSFDFDDLTVTLQAGDTSHELPWDWGPDAVQVGDQIALSSDGEEVGFVDAPADPSWRLGLAAGAPAIAVMLGNLSWLAEWQRRRLLRRGGQTVAVRVTSWGSKVLVIPVDGEGPALEILNPQAIDGKSIQDWEDAPSEEEEFEGEDDDIWSGEEFQAPTTREELVELANEAADLSWLELDDEADEAQWEGWFGPHPSTPEAFTMTGRWRWGASVALTRDDGRIWLGEVAEAPPWTRWKSDFWEKLAHGVALSSTLQALASKRPQLMLALRWVAAILAAVVLGALAWLVGSDEADGILDSLLVLGFSLLPALFILAVGEPWTDIVVRTRRGVTRLGLLHDEHIGSESVWDVAASTTGDTIALGLKDDGVVIDVEAIADDRAVDAESGATVLHEWLAAGRGKSGHTLTPGAWGTLFAIAVAISTFVVYLPK